MGAYTVRLGAPDFTSDVVSDGLFGTNVVFTKDYLDAGGPFERLVDELNFTGFRFPGGTVTERRLGPDGDAHERFFNPDLPGDDPDGGRITTPEEMFAFAGERDADIQFVLATEPYLGEPDSSGHRAPDTEALEGLYAQVEAIISGTYGPAEIHTFAIGNEFWYLDERMTASEYGELANEMAIGLQEVFDDYAASSSAPDDWQAPRIGAQVSQGWEPDDNTAILDALSMEARGAIDVAIQHFYPAFYDNIANSGGAFDRMDEWQEAEGFGDLEYYVSEWNIAGQRDADHGLEQAGGLIETFDFMLERGVDFASIWGTQYLNLDSRLSRLLDDPDNPDIDLQDVNYELTAAGEIFRMMSEDLPGKRALDLDARGVDGSFAVHGFADAGETVLFVTSRSDAPVTITLDAATLVPEYNDLIGTIVSTIDAPGNAGDPTSPLAEPEVTVHGADELVANGRITLELDPYAIAQLKFDTDPDMQDSIIFDPANLSAEDLAALPPLQLLQAVRALGAEEVTEMVGDLHWVHVGTRGNELVADEGDNLIISGGGSTTLRGVDGDNVIIGADGKDHIYGGPGDNIIDARGGDNIVWAGSGNNRIYANHGDNVIGGGSGDSLIEVGNGDNLIYGGRPGDNTITAGDGDNRIWAGTGSAFINAGDGNNVIGGGPGNATIAVGDGDNTIYSGRPGENTIFAGDGENLIYGGTGAATITVGDGNNTIRAGRGDNVITTGTGDNRIIWNGGNNEVTAAGGNNVIEGGRGDDVIHAGPGDDIVSGGGGADTFIFKSGDGTLQITDFTPGIDSLHLDEALWGGDKSAEAVMSEYATMHDGDTVLAFDDHIITLAGLADTDGLSDDVVLI